MQTPKREYRTLSEINVTPFVDVMLVLLIIFMVTAPMLHEGLDVALPQVKGETIKEEASYVTITVNKEGQIFIDDDPIPLSEVADEMRRIKKYWDKKVLLKADRSINYGLVVQLMAALREAGIEDIGMVTEPLAEEEK
ncbi:MAG: protein TolR [Deltaproteobacteria bacterium]|uniref:Protein TolR n=1 Tax=Candidatus Zymogenus saltonus TaxID=2844893 RepID=A0A9D8KII3_9DELT|nr:protein TolR [Candidatus Zymogenus saltonus]